MWEAIFEFLNGTIGQFLRDYSIGFVGSFTMDFGRYLFAAGGVYLIVWVFFRDGFQSRKIRLRTPKSQQMWREFGHSIKTVIVYSLIGMLTYYGLQNGMMQIYGTISMYGWVWFSFSLTLMVVAHDAYFYWVHWLMHRKGVMKYIHNTHHRSHNPTPWAAYSFDVFEAAVHALFVPLFLIFVPVHSSVIMLFLAHMIIRNAVGHSGYELFPRHWATHPVLGMINLVTHHDLHHANGNYNFGLYFTWWDRIMGTEHPDYIARATGDKTAQRRPLFPRPVKQA